MSNFSFLPEDLKELRESAGKAEETTRRDPRTSCFYARFTLEKLVHWLFRFDSRLKLPYDISLGALLHDNTFQTIFPESLFQKARVIQRLGNLAVHNPKPIKEADSFQSIRELHHICFWLVRTYFPNVIREGAGFQEKWIPESNSIDRIVSREELEALQNKLREEKQKTLEKRKTE
jgi:type I restriction enzyme, R subunit